MMIKEVGGNLARWVVGHRKAQAFWMLFITRHHFVGCRPVRVFPLSLSCRRGRFREQRSPQLAPLKSKEDKSLLARLINSSVGLIVTRKMSVYSLAWRSPKSQNVKSETRLCGEASSACFLSELFFVHRINSLASQLRIQKRRQSRVAILLYRLNRTTKQTTMSPQISLSSRWMNALHRTS